MKTRKLLAVAMYAAVSVSTTALAADDFGIESASPVTIADPINPKPGMIFRGYNLNTQYDEKLAALGTTLASAPTVKTAVVVTEQFAFDTFLNNVEINQGVWEGFLKCKRTANCTFLLKQKGDYSGGGFLLFVNGQKVIYKSGTGQQSANVRLKVGFNHIKIISQARYPVDVFLSPTGSTKPPRQLSPTMMYYNDKPEDEVI